MSDRIESFHQELVNDTRTIAELIDDALAEWDSDEGTALAVLTYRGTHEVFVACRDLCQHKDSGRRSLGARVLGQLGFERRTFPDESIAVLIPMLEDDVADVIANAAIALGFRGDDRAITPLLAHIAHWDVDVRHGVAYALGCFSRPDAIAGLIALSRDEAAYVRDWATFGLQLREDVDTPAVRQALADRLDDEDGEVRGEAMIGLAQRKDARVIPAIRAELLYDDDLEGDWVFEAAELMADATLHADLVAFTQRAPEWCEENPNNYLAAALKACSTG